jgi:hypothetical protein
MIVLPFKSLRNSYSEADEAVNLPEKGGDMQRTEAALTAL